MIHVLGFYNSENIGDEQYKISFKKLLPDKELIFCKDMVDKPETIILGGGDIFNETMINKIKKFNCKKYAFSVNLRSPEYCSLFEKVISRNNFKENNVDILPDFAFCLEANKENGKLLLQRLFHNAELYENVVIVVMNAYLPRELYRDYITFEKVCFELAHIMDNTNASFLFIPFGVGFPYNDNIPNSLVYSRCKWWKKNCLVFENLGVQNTLDLFAVVDAAIITRLHAGIFSCIGNTPFINLCHHTKTKYLTDSIQQDWSLDYWHLNPQAVDNLLKEFLANKVKWKEILAVTNNNLKAQLYNYDFRATIG